MLEAPCWGWCARPPWSQAEPAGMGFPLPHPGSLGSASVTAALYPVGNLLQYVTVSGCWREIHNISSY